MFSVYLVNNRELSDHSLDESMSSTLVYQVAALVIENYVQIFLKFDDAAILILS